MKIRGLWTLPDGRDWLQGKLGLALVGKGMLSKSLIQFSADGWGCVPSHPPYRPRPNYGRGNGLYPYDLFQKDLYQHTEPPRIAAVRVKPGRLQSMGSQRVGHD